MAKKERKPTVGQAWFCLIFLTPLFAPTTAYMMDIAIDENKSYAVIVLTLLLLFPKAVGNSALVLWQRYRRTKLLAIKKRNFQPNATALLSILLFAGLLAYWVGFRQLEANDAGLTWGTMLLLTLSCLLLALPFANIRNFIHNLKATT
jgi:hypothetical protein